MKNKLTTVIIIAAILINMCAVSVFAETAPAITVGSVTGKTGTTVEIPVVLSNNTGFASLGIEIGYDETALTLTNVVASSSVGATFTKAQAFTVNPYNMSWDSAENVMYNGTLVTLTFEIITDIIGEYPITLDYYKGRDGNYIDGNNVNYDENFEPLNLNYVSGKIIVTENEISSEDGPTVTVGTATGSTGETVDIPVVLSDNTGFASLGIEVGYDKTALKLTNAVANSSTGATFTKAQTYTVTPYNMSWDSAENIIYNGTLVTLTFEIITDVSGDYPITVDYYKGRDGNYADGKNVNYDENFKALGLKYINGSAFVTKAAQNTISVDSNFNITLSGEVNVGTVYAALYEGNVLKETKKYPATKNINAEFNSAKSGNIVKAMWLKDNLKPMCKNKTITLP